MTPTQELCNALTMLLPSMAVACCYWLSPNYSVVVILCGGLIHLPAAVAYHVSAAYGRLQDNIDNDLRRMDQTYTHIVAALYSYALSASTSYAALNGLINAGFIWQLWKKNKHNNGRHWMYILLSVLLYTLPMLYRGDVENYTWAMAYFVMGGATFVPYINYNVFNGWGHSIFHLFLVLYGLALSKSARKVEL